VSLPIHPRLSDGDVDDVVAAVLDIVTRYAA
jgi:dTDP-4-amino-4,6-dideoxygalactose transaminase